MSFVIDSYTDTTGTALASHTGEVGATWAKHGNYSGGAILVTDANRIRNNVAGQSVYYASGTPPTADYLVKATFRCVTTGVAGAYLGVLGRMDQSGTLDCYELVYSQSAARWEMYKVVAGAATSLGTAAATLSASVDYQIELHMFGTSIKAVVDGSVVIGPVTDSAVTQVGNAGVVAVASVTDSNGYHLDYFWAGGNILPTGLASAEAFGTAVLSQTVTLTGIAGAEAFGTAALSTFILPSAVDTAEAFGTAVLVAGLTLLPSAIDGAEAFGTAVLATFILPSAIDGAEAFGTAVLASGLTLLPSAIDGAEAFGTAVLATFILPSAIDGAEAFGLAVLTGPAGDQAGASRGRLRLVAGTDGRLRLVVGTGGRLVIG